MIYIQNLVYDYRNVSLITVVDDDAPSTREDLDEHQFSETNLHPLKGSQSVPFQTVKNERNVDVCLCSVRPPVTVLKHISVYIHVKLTDNIY